MRPATARLAAVVAAALAVSGCCYEETGACVLEAALPSDDRCVPFSDDACGGDGGTDLRTCGGRLESSTCEELGFSRCVDGTWSRRC